MKYKHPLRTILIDTESDWDKNTTRPAVRRAFRKVVKCRTFALGALLFASQNELRLVPGTCKSRGCPSCGQRNTEQWQREQWAALPDIPYKGITLTMPDVLWPLFQHNRKLLACLSTLGAKVIGQLRTPIGDGRPAAYSPSADQTHHGSCLIRICS